MVLGKPVEKERARHGNWREAWGGDEPVGAQRGPVGRGGAHVNCEAWVLTEPAAGWAWWIMSLMSEERGGGEF